MSKRTRESQIKTIRQIQNQIRTYIRWKECGTVAKYFKKTDLIDHIYFLRLIFTLTVEGKIASKASKLDHVLRIILEKEYNETPDCAALPYLRLKNGTSIIPRDSKLPPERSHSIPSHRQENPQEMGKLLQTILPSKPRPLSKDKMVAPHQSNKKRRDRSTNLPLPQ